MEIEKLIEHKLRAFFKDESIVFDTSRFAGGLTNYNYIINIHGTDYVVRKPGKMTDQMINRKIEEINNSIASEFGVNSSCVFFDSDSGIKVSVYIENSTNIALANPSSKSNIVKIAALMKKIHESPKKFPNNFSWLEELEKYEKIIKELNGEFFFDYYEKKSELLEFINNNIKKINLVPCHNDTVPENFIVDSYERIYLIDWEYSGMNDPNWDVAAYVIESNLDKSAIETLIASYYSDGITNDDIVKIKSFIMAQDLLWATWALIRHYSGDDFRDYCYIRYDRFRKNINSLKSQPCYQICEMVKTN